jgi:RNA polymerase sigma-70 factor (ECF subfamily)
MTVTPPTSSAASAVSTNGAAVPSAVVESARRGDSAALAELYRQHREEIYRHAMRMLRDEQAALDVVQETFARAMAAISRTEPGLSFRPWVFRIGTNLCLQMLRKRRRNAALIEPDAVAAPAANSGNPERARLDKELAKIVDEALARLPDRYRQLLLLREIDALGYDELAEVTQSSPKSIKVTLHRARRRFYAEVRAQQLLEDFNARKSLVCEALWGLLSEIPTQRKLVRHLEQCEVCNEQKPRPWLALLPPVALPQTWPQPLDWHTAQGSSFPHGKAVALGVSVALFALAGGIVLPRMMRSNTIPKTTHPKAPPPGSKTAIAAGRQASEQGDKQGDSVKKRARSSHTRCNGPHTSARSTITRHRRSTTALASRKNATSKRAATPRADRKAKRGRPARLALRVQPSLHSVRVFRQGKRIRVIHRRQLRVGDVLSGRAFGVRFYGHQWVAVRGSVRLERVSIRVPSVDKGKTDRLGSGQQAPEKLVVKGVIVRLLRGSIRARATTKGKGIEVHVANQRLVANQGIFRVRKQAGKLHVESLSARLFGSAPVAPGRDRVLSSGGATLARGKLLAAPNALAPVSHLGALPPQLSWRKAKGPVSYRLRLARDSDFITLVFEERLVDARYQPKRLRKGRYFWQVIAEHDGRLGFPSKIYALRIGKKKAP